MRDIVERADSHSLTSARKVGYTSFGQSLIVEAPTAEPAKHYFSDN